MRRTAWSTRPDDGLVEAVQTCFMCFLRHPVERCAAFDAEPLLVLDQVLHADTAMLAWLLVRDLALDEQLDQRRTGDVEEVGCFLGGQEGVVRCHRDGFAL